MKIFNLLKNLNTKILKIMKTGFRFSFGFCILATIVLVTYEFYKLPTLFYTGISLLQSGLFFMVTFVICGLAFDKITNEV